MLCLHAIISIAAMDAGLALIKAPSALDWLKAALGNPLLQSHRELMYTAVRILGMAVGEDVAQVQRGVYCGPRQVDAPCHGACTHAS